MTKLSRKGLSHTLIRSFTHSSLIARTVVHVAFAAYAFSPFPPPFILFRSFLLEFILSLFPRPKHYRRQKMSASDRLSDPTRREIVVSRCASHCRCKSNVTTVKSVSRGTRDGISPLAKTKSRNTARCETHTNAGREGHELINSSRSFHPRLSISDVAFDKAKPLQILDSFVVNTTSRKRLNRPFN